MLIDMGNAKEAFYFISMIFFAVLLRVTSVLEFKESFCYVENITSTYNQTRCDLYLGLKNIIIIPPYYIFIILAILFLVLFLKEVKERKQK